MRSITEPENTPEGSWELATETYRLLLEISEPGPDAKLSLMIRLIERLAQHGLNRRYHATRSHEVLGIRHFEHRQRVNAPAIIVHPRDNETLDCRFHRTREGFLSPATREILGVDLERSVEAISQLVDLLEEYKDEVPSDDFNPPAGWYSG